MAAEQRVFAVAKLKGAASFPRMKDDRRPPMHVEAASEEEKSQVDEKADGPQHLTGDQPSEGREAVCPPPERLL
jgi:serine/arginine repetitive matrix protein 2